MFKGSNVALITPFKNNGLDEEAYIKLIHFHMDNGTSGLVPAGTTGESPTLNHKEHQRVIDLCIKESNGKIPVIAGTGSNSTEEAISLTSHAEKVGANGALIVTPYYNKPTQEGLYQHYKAINDKCGIPIIIYNIPGRSVIDMSVDTMARLFELKNIVGVKDATGDLDRVDQQLSKMGKEFIQLTGNDDNAFERRRLTRNIAQIEKDLDKETNPNGNRELQARLKADTEKLKKVAFYKHSIDDGTAEAIESVAGRQEGYFSLISAEATTIEILLGAIYGGGKSNLGMYLKGWDAEYSSIERAGRETNDAWYCGCLAVAGQSKSIEEILNSKSSL